MAAHAGNLALACGPTLFLKAVQAAAAKHGVRCQVSLENRMACGVGACLGCVAKDHSGHNVQTCTKGPVFWSHEITL
jgi:dihydroorotate dehydrogenase electron transfer subunit